MGLGSWSIERKLWAIAALYVVMHGFLYWRMYVWGLSGEMAYYSVLLVVLTAPVVFGAILVAMASLVFVEVWARGLKAGLRALLPLLSLFCAWQLMSQIPLSRLLDAGNRARFEKVVQLDHFAAWAVERLDEFAAQPDERFRFVSYENGGLPEALVEVLRSTRMERVRINSPEEAGNDACVEVKFGRDFRWGIYLGRKDFVPRKGAGGTWYKWTDGVYGWVDAVP